MVLVCIRYLSQRVKRQYQPLSAKNIYHEQVLCHRISLLIRRSRYGIPSKLSTVPLLCRPHRATRPSVIVQIRAGGMSIIALITIYLYDSGVSSVMDFYVLLLSPGNITNSTQHTLYRKWQIRTETELLVKSLYNEVAAGQRL